MLSGSFMKSNIEKIEEEIKLLSQKRAELFNEWAYLVKKNDREYELTGRTNPQLEQKAEQLLSEQKAIGKQIMKLLEKADNITLE